MSTTKLTKKQLLLIDDIREEIELYKEELASQVKAAKLNQRIGLGVAVVMGVLLLIKPDFLSSAMAKLSQISTNMDVLGSFIGEGIPILYGLKSFNNSKEQKKRLNGVKVFEKDLSRMKEGLISNSEEHLLNLEKDFSRYMHT